MTGDRIISALIGLVGAVSNNGKTEQTDVVMLWKQSFVNANNERIMMIQNLFIRKPRRNMSFLKAVHTP